ncbi:SpoIIE family protein phosphatase [Nocardioides dongkuii]|uniref:SpoIIE family protein phosphatase n=1 Tax=Nocardioides dongkuii TaxID=2760089 RepID=UPI0015FA31B9|nr:SpoIIE family protein phosphatase [Nocardioides dongkuii]
MTDLAVSAHTPAYAAVDLTTCDREPIHVPGAIQPHGVLLALSTDLERVEMASANARTKLGTAPARVVGARLEDVLGAEAAAVVRQAGAAPAASTVELVLDGDADGPGLTGVVDAVVHRSGDRLVVEIERSGRADGSLPAYRAVRGAMRRLAATGTVAELVAGIADEVASMTGFDRVMVYRFDPEWNGEVVAEHRRPDLNPFLGLHYPATDIPAQARRLYTVNWIRMIPDLSYVPVPIVPVLDPATGAALDLSHSTLRSVSPIHVEYLGNMGVTASMSVSLVVDGELWGLIACHHYSGPHLLSLDVRTAAEFLGQASSQLVAERERADDREDVRRAEALLAELMARTSAAGSGALDSLVADDALVELMGAGGVALCFDGVITSLGDVPPEPALRRIATLLRGPDSQPGSSAHLAELDPDLADVADVAAGALVLGSAPDRWLCWVRPELPTVVDWGGDPTNKQIARSEGPEVRLSPRKSFEKWQQEVRGYSDRWAAWHPEHAVALASHLASLLYASSREQVDMAEALQRSVIPLAAPDLAGLEVAARYQPASTFQLGGDWWDAFLLPGGRMAFVVGDVAGHGVAAATTMIQLRAAVRAHLFADASPAAALDRTDRFMDGLFEQVIATALVGTVEPATGRMVLAAAGHPPPLLVHDGVSRELEVATRPVLGLGVQRAEQSEMVLAPGDTLLVYTDGLVERRGVHLGTSLAQLVELAGSGPGEDGAGAWIDGMLHAVPGARDDDTTVLALRIDPAS